MHDYHADYLVPSTLNGNGMEIVGAKQVCSLRVSIPVFEPIPGPETDRPIGACQIKGSSLFLSNFSRFDEYLDIRGNLFQPGWPTSMSFLDTFFQHEVIAHTKCHKLRACLSSRDLGICHPFFLSAQTYPALNE